MRSADALQRGFGTAIAMPFSINRAGGTLDGPRPRRQLGRTGLLLMGGAGQKKGKAKRKGKLWNRTN
jgi:hypothetical protein